jgi:hypothetical protein
MTACYKNRIYNVVDVAGDLTLASNGIDPFDVSFSDPELIVDPTDEEVAAAENLSEWYGIGGERAQLLRGILRNETSLEEWYGSSDGVDIKRLRLRIL